MNFLSGKGEQLYGMWTILTFVTSLLVLFLALFGLLWGGFGVWQVNVIAVVALASSASLLLGAVKHRSANRMIVFATLLGAIPLPALVMVLLVMILTSTQVDAARLGSPVWWTAFAIYGAQVFLSSLRLFQLRTSR